MPPAVFLGRQPPPGRSFDRVVEPAARAALGGDAELPDIGVVKQLLADAVPVIDGMASGRFGSLLRDELFQLVLSVARVEATLRSLDPSHDHTIVGERRLSRPSRPGRLAAGLAAALDAEVEWVGPPLPDRFPASLVSRARALRWTRQSGLSETPSIIAAIGGPSERRALESVVDLLDSVAMLDFGLVNDAELAGFGSGLRIRDAIGGVESDTFLDTALTAWRDQEWWGAPWLPWIGESLRVMSHITLREAELFYRSAERLLVGADLLLTAKVRFARARAIVAAARDLGVKTVAIQHGMYVDGHEWTDLRPDVFGVSGSSFELILKKHGYAGDVVLGGAPFYSVPDQQWDCGIALQPPEGIVITSSDDYQAHVAAAVGAARAVLGESATIGFRLHPREDEGALRRLVGDDVPMTRDHRIGGKRWITIESSFVVEAVLSGAPTVLMNLNAHPWEYRFADMQGIAVARDPAQIEDALRSSVEPTDADDIEAWREEFAVSTGVEAARRIAAIVTERVG